ncbi:MAG: ExeM/NucH family extracellular endonuclease [Woeseiaceae bacterium]|nr:ExeM/NucH family extracellular endonuclease [Woeseiaceae bacterium]
MYLRNFLVLFAAFTLIACLKDANDAAPASAGGRLSIAEVQGNAASSPYEGRDVTLHGIVSGDFQDNDADTGSNLGGFFLQSVVADTHDDASTGIFVFDGRNPEVNVNAGDLVSVRGKVQEYFGETQLAATHVAITGKATPYAVELSLPVDGVVSTDDGDVIAALEHYEGMLVRIPQEMTVTDLYELERFGAVGLSGGRRLFQFTHLNRPDPDGYADHKQKNAARFLVLDDGQREGNVAPVRYLRRDASYNSALRVGNTVSGLVGNLRFSRGSGGQGKATWRLMPVEMPEFIASNPRPGKPQLEGRLRIASFNVLNYFSTVDDGQSVCGPENSNCRGADSVCEQARQLAKIVTAIKMMDADIVGLIELENNNSRSQADIVEALNERYGNETYRAIATGVIGDDTIRTGFIYKPATVSPAGRFAVLDSKVDSNFNDDKNRPALAQSFRENASNGVLNIVLNHFKSKGSNCEDLGDINTGDGQGNCNGVRTAAARALGRWLANDPTGNGDPDFLIIGDLNAYAAEDPLVALAEAGFRNLLQASAASSYSFVYDGQTGALDHALANRSLASQIRQTIEWHINADESTIHDYNTEHDRDPALFNADIPYRSSDHDPIIVGIDLTRN